jgi:hypothetical protein
MLKRICLVSLLTLCLFVPASLASEGSNPTLKNLTLTAANTEYSFKINGGVKNITFQARTNVDIRYALETGKVATSVADYMTLKAGATYWNEAVNTQYSNNQSLTIYFASATAGTVVEIEVWR